MTKERINKLRIRLWFHRCLYYVHNTTAILDSEYDRLEKELAELESKTKYLISESPSRRVGYDPPGYLKSLIGSLVKTHFKLQKEIKIIPLNLILWSGTRINQIDRMCYENSELLTRLNPVYTDRFNVIKLEIKQGKYSVIVPPEQERKPVFIPEKIQSIKPTTSDQSVSRQNIKKIVKNGQLSLFG